MNDNAIIELMRSCPDKGIYEVIRKYQGLIRTISARILRNEQDIEECISDTFFQVWRHLDNLHEDNSSLKGYLICTARNTALNRYRKNTRIRSVPQSDTLELIECQVDMEQDILQDADVRTMISLIEAMEEPEREIVITRNGAPLVRVLGMEQTLSFLSDKLVGVVPQTVSENEARDERISRQ